MVGHMAWVLVAGQDVVSVGIIDYWTLVIFVCQQRRCVEIISLVLTLTILSTKSSQVPDNKRVGV
jgi:hypothetical protein